MKYTPVLFVLLTILFFSCKRDNNCSNCISYGWAADVKGKHYQGSMLYGLVFGPDSVTMSLTGPGNNPQDSVTVELYLVLRPEKLDHSFTNVAIDSVTLNMPLGITGGYSSYDYHSLKAIIDSFNVNTHMIYGSFSGLVNAFPGPTIVTLTEGRFIAKVAAGN
jgi:hypothetical protein